MQRVIVVGASSGIGAALVRKLAGQGAHVVAVARRAEALETLATEAGAGTVTPLVHDVTDTGAVADAYARAVETLGGLDTIVYSAGVMPTVALDEFDTAKDKQIIDVNVIGAMAWLNEAASTFQAARSGTIVGIGSVAGDRGRLGNPAYCASKAALHAYLESLRNRLDRHGVAVITIKTGPVRTPMVDGRDKLPLLIEADEAADSILAAVRQRSLVKYVPFAWWPIMTVVRSIPSVIFRRTNV
jgi:short-subunit dehydrogenase